MPTWRQCIAGLAQVCRVGNNLSCSIDLVHGALDTLQLDGDEK